MTLAANNNLVAALPQQQAQTDAKIIAEGRLLGLNPDHGNGKDGPLGITWLRFRAACARVEMSATVDPRLRQYLLARANNADAEAAFREKHLARNTLMPTSPWDTEIAFLLSLSDDKEKFREGIKLALQMAYSKGYRSGRNSGYDEAAQNLTPTRHEIGG